MSRIFTRLFHFLNVLLLSNALLSNTLPGAEPESYPLSDDLQTLANDLEDQGYQ